MAVTAEGTWGLLNKMLHYEALLKTVRVHMLVLLVALGTREHILIIFIKIKWLGRYELWFITHFLVVFGRFKRHLFLKLLYLSIGVSKIIRVRLT